MPCTQASPQVLAESASRHEPCAVPGGALKPSKVHAEGGKVIGDDVGSGGVALEFRVVRYDLNTWQDERGCGLGLLPKLRDFALWGVCVSCLGKLASWGTRTKSI